MNTLNVATGREPATGNRRLRRSLPNSADAFWLLYLVLIAVLVAWLIA